MLKQTPSLLSKLKNKLLKFMRKRQVVNVVEFRPWNKTADRIIAPPVPASKMVPDWFKNLPIYTDPDFQECMGPGGKTNLTMKACMPALDSFMTGYMLTLPCDVIFVDPAKYNNRVIWDVSWQVISSHNSKQVGGMAPHGYEPHPFKWEGMWEIHMPKGYSFLITHPFYRYELPFITTTAVVDGDNFTRPLNIPFFLKEGFVGTIPKGTPIAQIIPIKREVWHHTVSGYDEDSQYTLDSLKSSIFRSYKDRWWNKKSYL